MPLHVRAALRQFVADSLSWRRAALFMILTLASRPIHGFAQKLLSVTPAHCKYKIGPNPEAAGPEWAQPGFDDSGWVSSLPAADSYLPPGPYQWTRCRLDLSPLAQTGPLFVQIEEFSAWQVFVDGKQVGSFGNVETGRYSMNLVQRFPLPQSSSERGVVLVALRETRRGLPSLRYSAVVAPISAGSQQTLSDQTSLAVMEAFARRRVQFICYGFFGIGGIFLLILSSVDRSRKDLFWLGLAGLGTLELRTNELAQVLLTSYPHWVQMVCFWVGQWLYIPYTCFFFSLTGRRVPRFYLIVAASTPILIAPAALSFVWGPRMDQVFWWWSYYSPWMLIVVGALGVISSTSPIAAFWPVWKIPPLLRPIFWVSMIWGTGETANTAIHLPWFSALDPTGSVREYRALVAAPVMLAMFFLLARRQKQMGEERSELQAEMQSAQEMQQLLMPAALDLQPWIQVEAAYLPAKDVGGDFYFCRRAGSGQLVVIGDVSGKGLRAAMLASNIVGALRNEDAGDPGVVLARLNEVVLQAHSGGFVTCLCALFEPGGRLRVANAGHIAPYVDGAELAVENGLPLGFVSGDSYADCSFLLGGKAVTLLSDGVLEARDAKGELLGFECMAALTSRPAAEVADAAQKWGQEDDITVLTVRSL
jgi:sigma-B regulation protein RsbU (phosphoserine phosphatase)